MKRRCQTRRPGTLTVSLLMLLLGAGSVGAQAPADKEATTEKLTNPAPDFKPDALWDGRKIVPFHAIDNPKMVSTSEAGEFLGDDEYVLGLTANGESRAYPTRFVWWHHAVNDTIGGTPVALTYCSVCNTGIRFDPVVNGKPIKIDFYGLYNGVACFCERETQGVLLQVDGRIVSGPMSGKTLPMRPLLDTTWGKWKALHPSTLVMSPDNEYRRAYRPRGQAEPRGYNQFPLPFFRPTVTRSDKRLPPFEKVLAVTVPAAPETIAAASQPVSSKTSSATDASVVTHRAYPIAALIASGGAINEMVGGSPTVVLFDAATTTAVALSRNLDGQTLTFEARSHDGMTAFYDTQTGTRWNVEGRGETGPLAGKTLMPFDNHLSQWYGWVAFFPETSIYGRTDAPQPGDPFAPPATRPAAPPSAKTDADASKPQP